MANQFVTSQLALGDHGPVNLDFLSTFEKFTHPRIAEKDGKFQIHFMVSEVGMSIRDVFWKYKDECDRDAEYDKLIATQTTTLN